LIARNHVEPFLIVTGLIVADWQDAKLSAVASLLQSEFLTTRLQPIVKVVTLAMHGVVTTSSCVGHFLIDGPHTELNGQIRPVIQ
jgi:hypothetical protein